jgi:hypothetical protein
MIYLLLPNVCSFQMQIEGIMLGSILYIYIDCYIGVIRVVCTQK